MKLLLRNHSKMHQRKPFKLVLIQRRGHQLVSHESILMIFYKLNKIYLCIKIYTTCIYMCTHTHIYIQLIKWVHEFEREQGRVDCLA